MPRPLVKASSLGAAPSAGAGGGAGGLRAPPKVSTLEELSALEAAMAQNVGIRGHLKKTGYPRALATRPSP